VKIFRKYLPFKWLCQLFLSERVSKTLSEVVAAAKILVAWKYFRRFSGTYYFCTVFQTMPSESSL